MRRPLTGIATAITLLTLPAIAAAGNWPSFRGENGAGIGDGTPPAHWDIGSGSKVCWKAAIEGLALSSPIVWNDRVFLTTAVGAEKSPEFKFDPSWGYRILREREPWTFKLICLDGNNGRRIWERECHRGQPRQGRHS
jgi:outer membrane protein assembly factor BamB